MTPAQERRYADLQARLDARLTTRQRERRAQKELDALFNRIVGKGGRK